MLNVVTYFEKKPFLPLNVWLGTLEWLEGHLLQSGPSLCLFQTTSLRENSPKISYFHAFCFYFFAKLKLKMSKVILFIFSSPEHFKKLSLKIVSWKQTKWSFSTSTSTFLKKERKMPHKMGTRVSKGPKLAEIS